MPKVCRKDCFRCVHPDCINDEPPSLKEIAIIEADDRYVRWSRLTDEEKQQRKTWKEYNKRYNETHKEEIDQKRKAKSAMNYERTKAWRERRRAGSEV